MQKVLQKFHSKRFEKSVPSYGKVTADAQGIITCELSGKATGDIVAGTMKQTRQEIKKLREQKITPVLLLDVSNLYASDSDARSQAKSLSAMGLERFAVVGANKTISLVGHYIVRAAGLTAATKFFKTRTQARRWLLHPSSKAIDIKNQISFYFTVIFTVIIAVTGLIGWKYDNEVLYSIAPVFPPMNPMSAVVFLLLCVSLLWLWNAPKSRAARYAISVSAGIAIVFGLLVLGRTILQVDSAIDTLLFQRTLEAGEITGRTKPLTAFLFVVIGLMMLLVASGQKRYWQKVSFHTLSVILFATSVVVISGYSFTINLFREWAPMSVKTAMSFLMLNHALQFLAKPLPFFARQVRGTQVYAVPIILCIAVLIFTATMWQTTNNDTQRTITASTRSEFATSSSSIEARIRAYEDALRGYKAFFEASSFVDSQDFHSYFAQSGLQQNYPGFISIAFVRNVPADQKSTYVKEMKAQAKINSRYNNLAIYPASSNQVVYPLTYTAPGSATSAFGFDLGSEAQRLRTLESARDRGTPAATALIDLNASRKGATEKRFGFFIAVPVYKDVAQESAPKNSAERQQRIYGFVNAYFQNDLLFKDIFKNTKREDIRFTITDTTTNEKLYTYNMQASGVENVIKSSDTITVADRKWRLDMYTTPEFGASTATRALPWLVLASGLLVAILATALSIGQIMSRGRALDLADEITEDLHKERNAAVATQQRQEAILTSIGDAVFAIDTKGTITLFNPAAEHISGYAAEEALGKPYREVLKFLLEGTEKEETNFIAKAKAGKVATMNANTMLVTKRGKQVPVADSAAPIHDAKGAIVGVIVVFRDVTDERALEQSKDEFVSVASHQLRTPLSAMNWYAEMLLNGDAGALTKNQNEYINEIYTGNQRMVELVNSLLDTSRLDLGKLAAQPEKLNLKELVESLHVEMKASIDKKEIIFKSDIHTDSTMLQTDRKLLRMILQNLMSNAVKYTPEKGSVQVLARPTTVAPEKSFVHIEVSDTGYGIPAKQQPKIFSKMFRADNVLEIEGTGLGLYIVKEAAHRLGGRVSFTSEEQKGTTFTIEIPVILPKGPKAKQ